MSTRRVSSSTPLPTTTRSRSRSRTSFVSDPVLRQLNRENRHLVRDVKKWKDGFTLLAVLSTIYALLTYLRSSASCPACPSSRLSFPPARGSIFHAERPDYYIPFADEALHRRLPAPYGNMTIAHLGWIHLDPFKALNYDPQWRELQLMREPQSEATKTNRQILKDYVDKYLKEPYQPTRCEALGLEANTCAKALERWRNLHDCLLNDACVKKGAKKGWRGSRFYAH